MYYETFPESCCCSFPQISDPMWTELPGAFLTKGEGGRWSIVFVKSVFFKNLYISKVYLSMNICFPQICDPAMWTGLPGAFSTKGEGGG